MSDKKVKSVRLNSYLREIILNSVLDEFVVNNLKPYGFSSTAEIESAAKQHRLEVCAGLWEKQYGSINFKAVPSWALDQTSWFSVAQQDDTSKVFSTTLRDEDGHKLPCKPAIDVLVPKEEWESLFKKSNDLAKALDNCVSERHALKKEVQPILESFGSTKALLDTWPSLEKFLPANVADPDKGIKLPALSLSRLEAKINGN